jgi:hypothetical protein
MTQRFDDLLRRTHRNSVIDVVLAVFFLAAAALSTVTMVGALRQLGAAPVASAAAGSAPRLAAPMRQPDRRLAAVAAPTRVARR